MPSYDNNSMRKVIRNGYVVPGQEQIFVKLLHQSKDLGISEMQKWPSTLSKAVYGIDVVFLVFLDPIRQWNARKTKVERELGIYAL